MFKNIIAMMFVVLLATNITQAADIPKNMAGYGKTMWGMTPDEVLKAESLRAEKLEIPEEYGSKGEWIGIITIKEIEIASAKFSVTFLFDKSEQKLRQVNLISFEKENVRINASTFSSIEKILTEKYGTPTYREKNNKVSWKLPKTTIELLQFTSSMVGFSQVSVRYRPSTATDRDAGNL